MSITIKRLDNEDWDKDILIVTGGDVIFKLYLRESIYDLDNEVKKFIEFGGLCEKKSLDKINQLKSLEEESTDIMDFFKKRRAFAAEYLDKVDSNEDLKRRRKVVKRVEKDKLEEGKNRLREISNKLLEISRFFGVKFTNIKKVTFCNDCNFLVSEKEIFETLKCPICEKSITRSFTRDYDFLNQKIFIYLKGDWFSDYIARLFRSNEWETWTNLYILGASGIIHEIDLLAIHRKTKETLIGECKTGKIGRKDVFTFSTKSQDTSSTFAYFFNIQEISEIDTRKFMNRNGILFVDDIPSKKESELSNDVFSQLYVS